MRSIDDLTHRIDTKTNEEDFVDKTYIDNIISTLNNKLYNIMSSNDQIQSEIQAFTSKVSAVENEINIFRIDIDGRATVEEVNSILNTKANKTTVIEALHRKVNRNEHDDLTTRVSKIESSIESIESKISNLTCSFDNKLDSKADISQIQILPELMKSKVDITDFHEIKVKLQESIIKQDDLSSKHRLLDNEFDNLLNNIRTDLQIINKSLTQKVEKYDMVSLSKNIEEYEAKLKQFDKNNINKIKQIELEISNHISNLSQICSSNSSAFEKINKKLISLSKGMEDLNATNHAFGLKLTDLSDINDSTTNEIQRISKEVKQFKEELTEITSLYRESATKDLFTSEINKLNSSIDHNKVLIENFITEIIGEFEEIRKEGINEHKEILLLKDAISTNQNDLKGYFMKELKEKSDYINERYNLLNDCKLNVSAFDHYIKNNQNALNELNINLKDSTMSKNLIHKADIEDVNKALNGIYNELDNKCTMNDFNCELEKVYSVLDSFSNVIKEVRNNDETEIAKFDAYGNFRNELAIQWEKDIRKDLPSFIVFDKKKSYIEIVTAGYYSLKFIIIDSDKSQISSVQLMINGEISSTYTLSTIVKSKAIAYFDDMINVEIKSKIAFCLNSVDLSQSNKQTSTMNNIKYMLIIEKLAI